MTTESEHFWFPYDYWKRSLMKFVCGCGFNALFDCLFLKNKIFVTNAQSKHIHTHTFNVARTCVQHSF